MTKNRRDFLIGGASLGLLGGCMAHKTEVDAPSRRLRIEDRVAVTKAYLYENVEGAKDLRDRATAILIMPLITQGAFIYGGAYGLGALQVNDHTIAYYSLTEASVGVQFGVQQYAHALFFMTERALAQFQEAEGFALGAELTFAVKNNAGNLSFDTTRATAPVIAVFFAQAGLIAGMTVEGMKYAVINP